MVGPLGRIPQRSKPFVRASVLDTLGTGLVLGVVLPFEGFLARRLGASPEWLTVLAMAPFFGFLAAVPASRLAFRFRWGVVIGSLLIAGRFCLGLTGAVTTPIAFVLVMVCMRVFQSSAFAMHGSAMRVHLHAGARPLLLKWMRTLGMLGAVPVAWLLGLLMDRDPSVYRLAFPVAGLLAALTACGYFLVRGRSGERNAMKSKPGLGEEWKLFRRDRGYALFLCLFFVGALGEKIGLPVTPIYFADVLNLRYSDVAAALGIAGPLLGVAGYFFWGALLRRWTPLTIVTLAMFAKGARPVLWALAATQEEPLVYVVAGEGLFRFCVSGMELGAITTVFGMSSQARAPVYMGLHYWFMGVRGMVGPVIGNVLIRSGVAPGQVYWVIAGVVFAGAVTLGLLRGRVVRREPD